MKRIHTKTVVTLQKIWTWRTQLLRSAQILIAPVIRKFRTTLQYALLRPAHFLHLVYHQLAKISKVRAIFERFQNNVLAHQTLLNSRRQNVGLGRISLYVLTERNEDRGRRVSFLYFLYLFYFLLCSNILSILCFLCFLLLFFFAFEGKLRCRSDPFVNENSSKLKRFSS